MENEINREWKSDDEELNAYRKIRERHVEALKKKIINLKAERDAMIAEYDDLLGGYEVELNGIGIAPGTDRPTETAVIALNFLKENPDDSYSGPELMKRIRREGAVASVIEARKICKTGSYRGTRYALMTDADGGRPG